jgi:murein DD-endopeptidase MepM/ murein hydrolase activator NlpD
MHQKTKDLIQKAYPDISGGVPFGWRINPISGQQEFHLGIDIAVSEGTSVYSTMNGTVNFAGWLGGYGYLVIIVSQDGSQWYAAKYAHLSQIEVQQGQQITRGQEIAKSGNTGFSTGPYLHYEVHAGTSLESVLSGNTAQNPEQWGTSYSHCP